MKDKKKAMLKAAGINLGLLVFLEFILFTHCLDSEHTHKQGNKHQKAKIN